MNSGSTNDGQQELIGELRRRFPLFERLVGRFSKDTQEERLPWFFALLLSAAMKSGPGACCFVLDKTPGTTAVAAVLLALVRFQNEFPELVKNYAQTTLSRGQRVRVKPNNHVYGYDGLWKEYPDFFKLRLLSREGGSCSFPIANVLQLEPTDRLQPIGRRAPRLGTSKRSHLDELLDLATHGNNSLIRNTVLLHMAQTRFAEVLDAITLTPEHADEFNSLSGFLPWGSIGSDGALRPNDVHQVAGEPIVAVTRVSEDLALAASSAPVASKAVLVDGARSLARDLQAFDDIADRQRMVILASPEEKEALELLRDRDCLIWNMSPEEILIGEASVGNRARTSLVGATIRAADTRQRVKVTPVTCQDSALQAAAASLEHAAAMIAGDEEGQESEKILARLFKILLECSECCFGVGEEIRDDLQTVQEQVRWHQRWLADEVAKKIQEAARDLENAIARESSGQEKANVLLDIIRDQDQEPWIVVARSPRTAKSLQTGLDDLRVDVPVLPASTISSDSEYAGIIVPAWPNDRNFTRLKNQTVTSDIRVLTYPFETKWLSRHQARERTREQSNRLEIESRSSILGIEPRFLTSLKRHAPDPSVKEVRLDLPIFRIADRVAHRPGRRPTAAAEGEDSREAQLVQFFGDCHALLTEWAELPKLNQLIGGTKTTKAELPFVTASQLEPGDFVLFRASPGDREFIRMIAEESLGAEEYKRVRTVAERWKSSLRHLGSNPDAVHRRLVAHGLKRTVPTVEAWLVNPGRIGPRDPGDIEFIAKAAEDAELLSIRKEVEEAIRDIRGIHQSAGRRLTQLLLGELGGRLNQLDEQPVLLDLIYGKAWVVQVEMVEAERRKYPSNLVNQLLWDDDTAF